MKGISICSQCADYSMKRHCCTLGAKKEMRPQDPFYDDCPLPDVVVKPQGDPAMGWISVKDRLPENNKRVLAYCMDRAVHDVVWNSVYAVWDDKGSTAEYLAAFVTHWMPMLGPQKMDGDVEK